MPMCTHEGYGYVQRTQDNSFVFCSGVQIKTRKRNIAVALDPGSFADAVVTIFEDQKDGDDLETNLLAGVKVPPHASVNRLQAQSAWTERVHPYAEHLASHMWQRMASELTRPPANSGT